MQQWQCGNDTVQRRIIQSRRLPSALFTCMHTRENKWRKQTEITIEISLCKFRLMLLCGCYVLYTVKLLSVLINWKSKRIRDEWDM